MTALLPLLDVVVAAVAAVTLVAAAVRGRLTSTRAVAGVGALVAAVLSTVLLRSAPWGRGGCADDVLTLVTSEIDWSGPGGPPRGCTGAHGQASIAWLLGLAALVVVVPLLVDVLGRSTAARTTDGGSVGG
ncbi:hypothetical protein [Cellulomonas sp. HZM]|uniref:hypothetical protein n=1 Tax=Cellulomonas sp. HZM TaxID=1454010 RepID=UPI000493195F|nr:hypothetical protein [Cellulomonas sp. HZM]